MFATKSRLIAAATLAAALASGAAHAGDVSWTVGIHAPIAPGATIGTVISNRHAVPVVLPAPVVYTQPRVVYAPPPVVYAPPPVVHVPAPVVHVPAPVYVPRRVVAGPVWVHGRWVYPKPYHRHHRHDGWRDGRGHWDHDDDHRGAPVYEPHRGRRG